MLAHSPIFLYTALMANPRLFGIIDKAVYDYGMIEKGDKLLVGASGGKDSTALTEYLAKRRQRKEEDFTFTAIHIQSEITPPLPQAISCLFEKWNVPLVSIYVNVLGRLKPGKKMNCFWCATQRRTELLDYAIKNGYTKLVLGHHLDDILETLLMNMLGKAALCTMPPLLKYKKYPLAVIRPLYYAPVHLISEHCASNGYLTQTCTCTYQDNSTRKEARRQLELLTGGDDIKKRHILQSLKNIQSEYLP